MNENDLENKLKDLHDTQQQIMQNLKNNSRGNKDIWDKLTSVAPIVSGLLIAVFGAYFSYVYNQQQIKLQELQTIEKFIPHLAGNEQTKKAAILAISSLTNTEFAGKLASVFASEGTVSALQSIAKSSTNSDRTVANHALAKALEAIAERNVEEGRLDGAKNNFQEALAIREKLTGSDSPDLCADLDRLSDLYIADGNYSMAEPVLKRSLKIKKHCLGTDDTNTINTIRSLASVLAHEGQMQEANELYKDVKVKSHIASTNSDANEQVDISKSQNKLDNNVAVNGTAADASKNVHEQEQEQEANTDSTDKDVIKEKKSSVAASSNAVNQ